MPQNTAETSEGGSGSEPGVPPSPASRETSVELPGDSIGHFRLLQKIGEGGFGAVWLAERREPYVQRVAIKIIKPGMDSRAVIARFEQERQALAMMNHPNVAKVLDGGVTQPELGSRPYFVMEFVKGEPITEFCDRDSLTIRQRLELFIPVCEAVQHAHIKGIIHRDLNPSNILVTRAEGTTQGTLPKVIDFGIAKAISTVLTDKTIYTESGQMIGTPGYMSPEQAEMGRLDIDTRTDVYSLGVVLYELLTGALPFDPRELRSAGYAGIQKILQETDPPVPSRRLTALDSAGAAGAIVKHRRLRFDQLRRELKNELEWIPFKAIRKEREERYRTALELADDVRNYLAGRPLSAGPASAGYRARKFLRKHRVAVAVTAVVAGALIAATAVSFWFYRTASVERDTALEVERFLAADLLSMGGAESSPGLLARTLVDRAAQGLEGRFAGRPAVEGRVRTAVGRAYLTVGEAARATEQLRAAVAAFDDAGLSSGDDRFRTATFLAEALYREGKAPDAEALLAPAIEARRARLGDNDPLVLDARNQQAGALKHAGRLDEAQAIYDDLLDRQRSGPSPGPALITQYNLALLTMERGKLAGADAPEKAQPFFEKALGEMAAVRAAMEKALGTDANDTLMAAAEHAALLSRLKRFDEAAAAFRPTLASMKRRFGERHWRTLEAEANYGIACARAGAWDAAAGALDDAVAGYREVRGPAYPDTISVQRWLARAQEKMGKDADAARTLLDGYDALSAASAAPQRLREQAALLAALYERRSDQARAQEWGERAGGEPPPR